MADAGAGERLIQILIDQRASAAQDLRRILTERRYLYLLDRMHPASVKPPIVDRLLAGREARQVLPPLVNSRWKKPRRDVGTSGRRLSDDQLHQVRKRSKQLRYGSELAAPVIGKAAKKTAGASESLQTLLGEHHDALTWSWRRSEIVPDHLFPGQGSF